jgi:hypothetical protein
LGTQQLGPVAAMAVVASETTIAECRLVQGGLALVHFRYFGVTIFACLNRVGSHQSVIATGVRAVTGDAFALRAGMLHSGAFNPLSLFFVAGDTKCPRVGLRQDNFSFFGFGVAGVASSGLKRLMLKSLCELWFAGLVRFVAAKAIGCRYGLVVMRLGQFLILHVMAVEAERRRILGQMEAVLTLVGLSRLVCHVAGVTSHV